MFVKACSAITCIHSSKLLTDNKSVENMIYTIKSVPSDKCVFCVKLENKLLYVYSFQF